MGGISGERLLSLDGLRGIAAGVVTVHHALLLFPSLAAPYFGPVALSGLSAALVYTPLHLFWAGTEAVYLFFVLSGLVLALATRREGFRWERYFPSRLVRLYGPVIGAVLLAAVVIALVPRSGDLPSRWLMNRTPVYPLEAMLKDMTLVDGASGIVSPLWSLQWEVLFSLSLPAFVVVARHLPIWLQLTIAITLSTIGLTSNPVLAFLPMFAIGVALARSWDRIAAAAARLNGMRSASWLWAGLLTLSLLSTVAYWLALPTTGLSRTVTHPLVLAGVTGLVVVAAFSPQVSGLLSRRPLRILGAISFSLYLVHEPIIVAVAFTFPGARWAPAVGIAVSLLVAWGFFLAVERPFHHLARRLSRGRTLPATTPI